MSTNLRKEFLRVEFDVVAAEQAEKSIDVFIERRASARSKGKSEANRLEEFWAASARFANAQRRRENLIAWIDYFGHMHRLHLRIAAEHADRRSRLMLEAGYEPEEREGAMNNE
jgi:hypothetical protein